MLTEEDDHIGTPSEGDEKSGTTFDSIGESGGTPNLTFVRAVIGAIAAVVNSSRQSYGSFCRGVETHSPANTRGWSVSIVTPIV